MKVLQIITEVCIYKPEILQFIFIKETTSSLSIFTKCSFYIMLRQAILSNLGCLLKRRILTKSFQRNALWG